MDTKDTTAKTEAVNEDEELEEGEIGDETGEKEKSKNVSGNKTHSSLTKNKKKAASSASGHRSVAQCHFNKQSRLRCKKLSEHNKKYNAPLPLIKSVVHARHSRNSASLAYYRRMPFSNQAKQNLRLVKNFHHVAKNIYHTSARHADFSKETRKIHNFPKRGLFNEDESYENLLKQYKRIQFQLEDLRRKEKKDREGKHVTAFHNGERVANENHYQKRSEREKRWRRSSSKISESCLGRTDKPRQLSIKKQKVSEHFPSRKNVTDKDALLLHNNEWPALNKKEEDEDELELRRKALASRNKYAATRSTVLETKIDVHNAAEMLLPLPPPLPSSPPPPPPLSPPPLPSPPSSPSLLEGLPTLSVRIDNFRDNYELVDMELDSDVHSSDESGDEVDIETLRAQLLNSLAQKKNNMDKENIDCGEINSEELKIDSEQVHIDYLNREENIVCEGENIVCKQEIVDSAICQPQFEPASVNLLQNTNDVKNSALTQDIDHSIPSRVNSPLEFPQKQTLVINLKDDSSSDESEINGEISESKNDINDQNVPAGLDLLLKEARMKADLKKNVSKNIASTPAAVYRLSKAQQLEYRKLKEMIAMKESNYASDQSSIHHQQIILALPSLEAKLNIANATLQKEKQLEDMLRIQLNKKKTVLRHAQLSVQKLREQLSVAEKVVVGNLQIIHRTNLQLRTVQSSVEKRNKLVLSLERECRKLGSQIYGSAYHPKVFRSPSLSRRFQSPSLSRRFQVR